MRTGCCSAEQNHGLLCLLRGEVPLAAAGQRRQNPLNYHLSHCPVVAEARPIVYRTLPQPFLCFFGCRDSINIRADGPALAGRALHCCAASKHFACKTPLWITHHTYYLAYRVWEGQGLRALPGYLLLSVGTRGGSLPVHMTVVI